VVPLSRPPHRAREGHDLLVGDMSDPDHPDADLPGPDAGGQDYYQLGSPAVPVRAGLRRLRSWWQGGEVQDIMYSCSVRTLS